MLWPSNITLKAEINIIDDDLVEIALRKINYWLEEFVRGSVIVPANDLGLSLILSDDGTPRIENTIIITPDTPTDDHVCILMQSKLQALASGAFTIGCIEITSDNAEGFTITCLGDNCDQLPEMDEWISGPTWFSLPWWARDDASTVDSIAPPDADLSTPPAWAVDLSFLARDTPPQEAIIMKGDFAPRIVGNDDTD
jgi:hypothetical protein